MEWWANQKSDKRSGKNPKGGTQDYTKFSIKTLSERRLELCTNYAVKLFKSDRSSDFFTHTTNRLNTRQEPQLVVEQRCRTKRAYNAPHNYLARIVNKNQAKIKLSLQETVVHLF